VVLNALLTSFWASF